MTLTPSEKIKILIKRKGLTQEQIGEHFGQSRQAFNNRLRRGSFSFTELEQVASVLGCTVDIVFTDNATGETL